MNWRTIIFGSVLCLSVSCAAKRTWNHELLSINATSSDDNLVKVHMQIDRLSFSESAVSGTIDWKFDAGKDTTVEMLLYHSASGRDDDYHETLYKIKKIPFDDYIDVYYKDFGYANLGKCSNLPTFKENKYVPPWPKRIYILRNCKLTGDGFPDFLPLGYYKLWLQFKGPVTMTVVVILKLTAKLI